jgi:beta-N-acetylhexosaminidase
MAIAATKNVDNAYQAGKITGEQLRYAGINFNLAPTVDVNSNMDNPVIGVRSYGDLPEQVAAFGAAMMKGLLDGGVFACAKHFPGHGDTNVDSHLGLPKIEKTLEELEQCELIPFKKLIEAGIPAVMTTHILFPKLEAEKIPATMSRTIITGLLREKMGFGGLIVSDCMEMGAIKQRYGTVEGVKHAIKAGVDLVFISHTAKVAREVSDVLTKALESNEIPIEEIYASVERILKYKEKILNLNPSSNDFDVNSGKSFAFNLLKASITPVQMPTDTLPDLGLNPLFIGAPLFRATNASNQQEDGIRFSEFLAKRFGGEAILIAPNPTEAEVQLALQAADQHSCIVIGTYNGHLYKGQLELIRQAAGKNSKVIIVALRNPYDLRELPKTVYGIAVYEYTQKSLEAIAQLFEHQFIPRGILPVNM